MIGVSVGKGGGASPPGSGRIGDSDSPYNSEVSFSNKALYITKLLFGLNSVSCL